MVDELFLTVAPQISGRDDGEPRLSLVEGRTFSVEAAPWAVLNGIRRAGNHMFLRYRFGGGE
jgi:riboflavin biosynthesis pyrimidine reductase